MSDRTLEAMWRSPDGGEQDASLRWAHELAHRAGPSDGYGVMNSQMPALADRAVQLAQADLLQRIADALEKIAGVLERQEERG